MLREKELNMIHIKKDDNLLEWPDNLISCILKDEEDLEIFNELPKSLKVGRISRVARYMPSIQVNIMIYFFKYRMPKTDIAKALKRTPACIDQNLERVYKRFTAPHNINILLYSRRELEELNWVKNCKKNMIGFPIRMVADSPLIDTFLPDRLSVRSYNILYRSNISKLPVRKFIKIDNDDFGKIRNANKDFIKEIIELKNDTVAYLLEAFPKTASHEYLKDIDLSKIYTPEKELFILYNLDTGELRKKVKGLKIFNKLSTRSQNIITRNFKGMNVLSLLTIAKSALIRCRNSGAKSIEEIERFRYEIYFKLKEGEKLK